MDDSAAISGEQGAYVPCDEVALVVAASAQDTSAVYGEDEGFVPADTSSLADEADATDTSAVFGRATGFVPGPCDCLLATYFYGDALANKSIDASQVKRSTGGAPTIFSTTFRLMSTHDFALQPPEPRFTHLWRDTSTTVAGGAVTDRESYYIMGFPNPYFATTTINRVRLTATLYPAFPGTTLTPGDDTPFPFLSELPEVPWSLFSCSIPDPPTTYPGIDTAAGPNYTVDVSDAEFQAPVGTSLITSGIVPEGGLGAPIDISWNVSNPQYVQFYLRTYSDLGYYPETLQLNHPTLIDRFTITGLNGQQYVSKLNDFNGNLVPSGSNYVVLPTLQLQLFGPC